MVELSAETVAALIDFVAARLEECPEVRDDVRNDVAALGESIGAPEPDQTASRWRTPDEILEEWQAAEQMRDIDPHAAGYADGLVDGLKIAAARFQHHPDYDLERWRL